MVGRVSNENISKLTQVKRISGEVNRRHCNVIGHVLRGERCSDGNGGLGEEVGTRS